tara:strand:- start:325 stop:558 length:234 start_codon:yes stop_codon:yes gene_type:complete
MNFKFNDKDYDSDKLSNNGKLYFGKLQNINAKEQQLTLEAQDLAILKVKYTELLKAELSENKEEHKINYPKDEPKEN